MNVNGIGKQPCYERTNGVGKNNKNHVGGFSKSLSENMNGRMESDSVREENTASAASASAASLVFPYRNMAQAVGGAAGNRLVESSKSTDKYQDAGKNGAVRNCEVKHLTNQKSDYTKAYAVEGFLLMAQVEENSRSVYVEQKLEDGAVKGYEVNIDTLDPDTEDPVERAALEAWEQKMADGGGEPETLTVEEALQQFYEFIEDRIKNGPPKYMIGNSEFSVEEWDKLLEDFDEQLDAIREEMRERIEKLKEQQLLAEASGELQDKRDEVQEASEEKTEEKLMTALFQDKGK